MFIDLSNFTNEELFDMVDSLNMSTIPDNASIRAVTRKYIIRTMKLLYN